MSIIQQLKTEGVLKLYMDFRSGTYSDWSGNDNHGTPTDVYLDKAGVRFVNPAAAGTNLVSVPNTSDFNFGTSTDFSIYIWIKSVDDLSARNLRLFSNSDITGGCFADIQNNLVRIFFEAGASYTLAFDSSVETTIPAHLCWTFDRDGSGLGYYNGGLVATTATNPGDINEDLDTSNPLQIGKVLTQTANMFDGDWKSFIIVNRVLTATEVSQIKAELENTSWPTKSKGSRGSDYLIEQDTSLVGAYDMKPTAGVVVDESGNNNDMSIIGDGFHTRTPFGNGIDFLTANGNYLNKASFNNLPSTAITVSAWTKTHANVDWNDIVQTDNWDTSAGTWILYTNSLGRADFGIAEAGSVQNLAQSATGRIVAGFWNHIVGTYDGTTVKVYVDGVIGPTTATVTQALDTTENISIAQDCQQIISNVKIYNEAKDQAWVTKEYENGAKTVSYKTDWFSLEIDGITAGQIGGTDFNVKSGTWDIEHDEPFKTLVCASSGYCTVPPSGFNSSPTEAAYGTWEFTLKKVNGSGGFVFMFSASDDDDWNAGTQNGYTLHIDSNERVRLRKVTNGSASDLFYTDVSYIDLNTFYTYRITRTNLGEWTAYIKGGAYVDWTLITPSVGTNPATENTFTTANYIVFSGTTNNVLVLGELGGDNAIVKRVGVYND